MAKRKHLINVHTSTGTTAPTGASLYLGEIAVQHKATDPALWIKVGAAESSTQYEKFVGEKAVTSAISQAVSSSLTGVSMNGSEVSVANNVAALGTVITAETQLSTATTGTGNVVGSIAVSNHKITSTMFSAASADQISKLSGATQSHTANTTAHTTDAEKTRWNNAWTSGISAYTKVEALSAATTGISSNLSKLSAGTIALVASSAATVFSSAKTYTDNEIGKLDSTGHTSDASHYLTSVTITNGIITAVGEAAVPSETSITTATTGDGNVISNITATGHQLTLVKGVTAATSAQVSTLSAATHSHVTNGDIHVTAAQKTNWTNSGTSGANAYVGYIAHSANTGIHVTTAEKNTWNGKQDAISDLATIRNNALSGASAYTRVDALSAATTAINQTLNTVSAASHNKITSLSAATTGISKSLTDLSAVTLTAVTANGDSYLDASVASKSAITVTTKKPVVTDLSTAISTTGSLADAKAIKTYIDNVVSSTVEYKGATATLPTNPSVGDMWVAASEFTAGGKNVEAGDFIIARTSGSSATWDVIEKNLDGAVTGNLTADTVTLGESTNSVKSLANGSNGTVLAVVSNKPAWTNAVKVNSATTADSATNAANASTVNNHTVNSDVPANALFTDSATTETGHYSPTTSATTKGTTADTTNYVKGIRIDSKNHVIDVVTGTVVTAQTQLSYNSGTSVSNNASAVMTGLTVSDHAITYGKTNKVFSAGTADSAATLTGNITSGQVTNLANVIKETKVNSATTADSASNAAKVNNHTVETNVPSSAVFTDTATTQDGHYTPSASSSTEGSTTGFIQQIKLDSKKHVVGIVSGTTSYTETAVTTKGGTTGSTAAPVLSSITTGGTKGHELTLNYTNKVNSATTADSAASAAAATKVKSALTVNMLDATGGTASTVTFDGSANKTVNVPANTDEKVTAVANHYTATTATKTGGTTTGTAASAIKGITYDAAGHIVGVTTGSVLTSFTEASVTVTNGTPVNTAAAVVTGITTGGTNGHELTLNRSNKVLSASVADDSAKLGGVVAANYSLTSHTHSNYATTGDVTSLSAATTGISKNLTDLSAVTITGVTQNGTSVVSNKVAAIVETSVSTANGTTSSTPAAVVTGITTGGTKGHTLTLAKTNKVFSAATSDSALTVLSAVTSLSAQTAILGPNYTYSGISYVNSATSVADAYSALTNEMLNDEKAISAAFNDLNTRVNEISAATQSLGGIESITLNGDEYTGTSVDLGTVVRTETQLSKGTTTGTGNVVTDLSVSNHQITLAKSFSAAPADQFVTLSGAAHNKIAALSSATVAHINSAASHVSATDRTTWNGKQDAISDLGTIRNNALSGASAYTMVNALSAATTAHTANTTVHVTAANKTLWNAAITGVTSSGTGNAFTDYSVSGNKLTLTKGATYLTTAATTTQGGYADSALQIVSGSTYIEMSAKSGGNGEKMQTATVKQQGVETASATGQGLADAYDVKQYVEGLVTSSVNYKGATATLPTSSTQGDMYITTAQIVLTASQSATGAAQTAETGDFIIARSSGKWDVIQKNLDGAITGSLTADTVTLGSGTHTAKSLANGSNGQVLAVVSNKPAWTSAVKVNSATTADSATNATNATNAVSATTSLSANVATNATKVNNHTVNSDVPASALFTDSATTETGHYSPSTSASTKGTTAATTNFVKGIRIDSKNHVIDVVTGTVLTAETLTGVSTVGTAIALSNKVANIPSASSSTFGVVKVPATSTSFITNSNGSISVATGSTSATVARGDHNHNGVYATTGSVNDLSAVTLTGVSVVGTALSVSNHAVNVPSASSTAFGVVKAGSFLTSTNGTLSVNTGTTNTTVAVGNHTHSDYVNQNAFGKIAVGSSTGTATSTTDTLTFSGAGATTVSIDTTNRKITVNTNDSNFVHKTGAETIGGAKTFDSVATFNSTITTENGGEYPSGFGWIQDYNGDNLQELLDGLSAKTSHVLTMQLNGTQVGQYSPSANTTINMKVDGTNVMLTSAYTMNTGTSRVALEVTSADSTTQAFGKVSKVIYLDELITSSALNDLNDRVYELEQGGGAASEDLLELSGVVIDLETTVANNYTELSNRIDNMGGGVLSSAYTMATGSTEQQLSLHSGDTFEVAFGKMEKREYDNELAFAAALNVLNNNIQGIQGLPAVTSADNGKILAVVNGQWALVSLNDLLNNS